MSTSGIQSSAQNAATTAQGQSTAAYGAMNPIYTQMATNPQGYTPQQSANMITQSGQSLGGGQAAAVGAANLMTARTGNAGGYGVDLDAAARTAGRQQSANSLDVATQSAQLQRAQQAQGLAGLNSIYNGANSTGTSDLNAATNAAAQNPYMKLGMQAMSSAGQTFSGKGP
jgi:hypothetical protein